jgi:hypothetical protein
VTRSSRGPSPRVAEPEGRAAARRRSAAPRASARCSPAGAGRACRRAPAWPASVTPARACPRSAGWSGWPVRSPREARSPLSRAPTSARARVVAGRPGGCARPRSWASRRLDFRCAADAARPSELHARPRRLAPAGRTVGSRQGAAVRAAARRGSRARRAGRRTRTEWPLAAAVPSRPGERGDPGRCPSAFDGRPPPSSHSSTKATAGRLPSVASPVRGRSAAPGRDERRPPW